MLPSASRLKGAVAPNLKALTHSPGHFRPLALTHLCRSHLCGSIREQGPLTLHSGFAKPINHQRFFLSHARLEGYPPVHREEANSNKRILKEWKGR